MNISELRLETFEYTIGDAIRNKQECVLYSLIPANIVYAGKGTIDYDYCRSHNYIVYPSVDFGKGLVATKGDIVIVAITKDGWTEHLKIANVVIQYLKQRGINVSLKSNDIMIDDKYKVASYSSINIGDNVIYTGFQVTFNPNVEDIEAICKRPLTKIPKGLKDYGIVSQDLLNRILEEYR